LSLVLSLMTATYQALMFAMAYIPLPCRTCAALYSVMPYVLYVPSVVAFVVTLMLFSYAGLHREPARRVYLVPMLVCLAVTVGALARLTGHGVGE